MKLKILQDIIKKKNQKNEFAIVTNLKNGESQIYEPGKNLSKEIEVYKDKVTPSLPVGADILMSKFNIPEGKSLGNKLKIIEETWVQNGFKISDKQVQKIVKDQIYFTSLISKFLTPDGVLISTKSLLFLPINPFPIGD